MTFQRTLRIPDDGNDYPLPPGLGQFPVRRVDDYAAKVPRSWREHGGVFLPMYQREALWLQFGGTYWRPNALKIGVGKVNAVSGEPWSERLQAEDERGNQDYVVVPAQPWLDGINSGDGTIRQFVAMPSVWATRSRGRSRARRSTAASSCASSSRSRDDSWNRADRHAPRRAPAGRR